MSDVIPLRRGPRSHLLASAAMALFLFSWGVGFVALFVGYAFVRIRQPHWPPPGVPVPPLWGALANTFVVFASSVTFHFAMRSVHAGRQPRLRLWVLVTGALGLTFLALQSYGWVSLWQAGLVMGQDAYAGMYYLLTCFHAAHVVVGVGLLIFLLPGVFKGRYTRRNHQSLRFVGWFWHFVTGAWVAVVLAVYAL